MYNLAKRYEFDENTKVLITILRNYFFLPVFDNSQNAMAFKLDTLNFKIAQKRVPKATIYNQYFETAFLELPRFTPS